MRYRLEMLGEADHNAIIVRNVETDLLVGGVGPLVARDPKNPSLLTEKGCRVLDARAREISTLTANIIPDYLPTAVSMVASHDKGTGYAEFKSLQGEPNDRRIEGTFGTLLADMVCVIARALVEHSDGGLQTGTKERYVELVDQLYRIWFVSHFGSWNAETRRHEPYFAGYAPWEPRLSFADAAREYGKEQLSLRFPEVDDAILCEFLSQSLEMFDGLLKRVEPHAFGFCSERP